MGFLDDLEQKEEAAAVAESSHVFAAASSGWKKGFLGGGGSSKPKKKAASAPAAQESKDKVIDTVPKKEVSFSADTAAPTTAAPASTKGNGKSSSDETLVKRPTAFSGVIKERF